MRGKSVPAILLPVILAAGLGACANNGVQPGIVNTASASGSSSASTYGGAQPIGSGRVVAINDVSLQGGGGSSNGGGPSNGTMIGGLLGGLGGIAIGASGGRGVGGGVIGGVLGAVGGAIAGTIIDRHTSIGGGGGGRGIEVVVQKDDGQQVTVAQRDDGDVQLGDRVQIVQGRNGTAKAVRDNSRQQDYQNGGGYQNSGPAPQDYRQAGNYGGGNYGGGGGGGGYGGGNAGNGGYGNANYGGNSPAPQDYRQGPTAQDPGPQPADYGQQPQYAPPQSSSHSGYGGGGGYQGGGSQGGGYQNSGYQDPSGPQPQNDPRYGTLQ
jgi:outer membrane lipoprotein SlyB